MKKILFLAAAFLLLGFCCGAQEMTNPSTIQSVKARVLISGTGSITGNMQGSEAKISMPSFKETASQKILSLEETLTINNKSISAVPEDDNYGNRYAVFTIKETGTFSYAIEATIETNARTLNLKEFDLSGKITENTDYTGPTKNVESNDARIRTIALNRFDSNSWLETVRAVTQWTHDYITYDTAYYPETYSALQTLESKRGVCDEFAVLAGAMLRAREIPVRFPNGIVFDGKGWGYHAWMQAFNPAAGWADFDPTFGEAGIVDGMHFTRGSFPDPANATTKIVTPGGADASIEEKEPVVELLKSREFSGVLEVEAKDIEFPAGRWIDLNVTIRNLQDSALIAPVQLGKIEGLLIEGESKVLLFQPLEEKNIGWKVKMDKTVEENQYLVGSYKIITLGAEKEAGLKVTSGSEPIEARMVLRDLLPLVEGKDLVVQATIENTGSAAGQAKISVADPPIEKAVTIEPRTTKTESVKIEGFSQKPYSISVTGPGLDYDTRVVVQEGKAVEQKPPAAGNPPATGAGIPAIIPTDLPGLLTTQNILLGAIAIGAIVILFLLKALLSK